MDYGHGYLGYYIAVGGHDKAPHRRIYTTTCAQSCDAESIEIS